MIDHLCLLPVSSFFLSSYLFFFFIHIQPLVSMGRSRSTPGLVESKSNLHIVETGVTKESRREKRSAVHLTPSPVGHGGSHVPTSSASVANLISSSDDQVAENQSLDHHSQQMQQHQHQHQQQQQHQQHQQTSGSESNSIHQLHQRHPMAVTYVESDSGILLPPPPTYTSVQVSQSYRPASLTVSQVGHSVTNTTPTLGLTLATPTYPSSVPTSSYLFGSSSQYEQQKSPLYHNNHDRRPSTPSPIDSIGGIAIAGGSSSSTVQSPCQDTVASAAFKPSMSPALSAPHLQSAILPSMHPISCQALSVTCSTSSAVPLSRTPVPGEMSQELLILEIKRLRDRLQTLECENAAMTSKLNQQSWEVCNRLAEIEFQISTNSGGGGGSGGGGVTSSSSIAPSATVASSGVTYNQLHQTGSLDHHSTTTMDIIDLPRHAITIQQQPPYSNTSGTATTVSPSASSSGSVTCDESERNRESVI